MAAADYLISPPDLAAALDLGEPSTTKGAPTPPHPTVLDARWSLGAPSRIVDYRSGHVPTASFVDMDSDLAAPVGDGSRGRHPLPSAAGFEAAMRRAGVSADRPVVVYDDRDSTSAGRAWWLLRYFGHRAVLVLDGGLAAWTAGGLPLESGERPVTPGDFVAVPGNMREVGAEEALRLARSGVLIDSRAAERYRGEVEPIDRAAGHIPGALSLPTGGNVDATGRFKQPAELRERFEAVGVREGAGVAVYCGSGITAAHQVLALSIAGFEGSALYPGSWSEWVADPSRPAETGGGAVAG